MKKLFKSIACQGHKVKKPFAILWLLFLVFVMIRVIFKMPYWLVLSLETCGLAISLLIKSGKPSKKYIYIAAITSAVSTVAYLGYQKNPWIVLYGLRAGIPTLLCSLAVFSVMEKTGAYAFVSKKGRFPVLTSIMIGIAVGTFLSVINTVIAEKDIRFDFSSEKLLLCLNPAIYEEMACRAIFMAFCIWYTGKKMNLFETFSMYFMMSVPHAAVHGYPLIQTMILTVLFGLPFAIVQRKRDITSAMIGHGLVDAVRFTLTGI